MRRDLRRGRGRGRVMTGFSETQDADPLVAGKKCSTSEINNSVLYLNTWNELAPSGSIFLAFLNFLTILTSFWKLVALVCIQPCTHESRFSKSTERIKSKNTSFERFFKRRTAKILVSRLVGLFLQTSQYHIVWIEIGLFGKHFQSAGQENLYIVCLFVLSLLRKLVFSFLCMTDSQ